MNQDFRNEVGIRLKQYRQEHHFSQDYYAEKLGITTRFYSELESGKKLPSIKSLNCMHESQDDFDFDRILLGIPVNKSAFSKYTDLFTDTYRKKCLFFSFLTHLLNDLNSNSQISFPVFDFVSAYNQSVDNFSPDHRIEKFLKSELQYEKNTKTDLANIMGISCNTLDRYTTGETIIQTESLINLYTHFGWTPGYILYGDINSSSHFDKCFKKLSLSKQSVVIHMLDLYIKEFLK